VKKKCDFLLTIPMPGSFDSLNVAVAAGIIQYEVFCQRSQTEAVKK
jgi:23S rRNA (guanosine2251-2'-O)-methyltransferase